LSGRVEEKGKSKKKNACMEVGRLKMLSHGSLYRGGGGKKVEASNQLRRELG